MRRSLRPDENKLWAAVASTVRLAPGRAAPEVPDEAKPSAVEAPRPALAASASVVHVRHLSRFSPEAIEPQRHRRIARGRDRIEARVDLHGLTQDRARQVLTAFLLNAQADGLRAVLVITGKGIGGDGVLRRRAPEWLADPALRQTVAGLSTAERHHGGEGAFYVALKRRVA